VPILKNFTSGLILSPPADLIPEGSVRSNRGISATATGSFRSRFGSSQIDALNAHSIFYFSNVFWYGIGTEFYRATVSKKSGLSGNRLSFAKCPPVAGIVDYLFFAGGGVLYKSKSDGTVQNWGISPPVSAPTTAIAAGGSLTADAVYRYLITYKNSVTGHRSNANTTAVSATPTGADLTVNLSAIPDGSAIDLQIDKVEIWRTEADGVLFFYRDQVNAGVTTYSDNADIGLSSLELPVDNDKPFAYFDDCLGPFNASMFWITRTQSGQRGRVFYSPIGRCESMEGYIEVTSDSNPLKKLFRSQGQLGVIAESGIFLIGGDNPYVPREVPDCPGTIEPFSVVETPYGLMYRAVDGIRLFDGNTSILVSPGATERLFRGEAIGDLSAFSTPILAEFVRNEYILSDTNQSIAVNKEGVFRDIGIAFSAIFYGPETDQIAVTYDSKVVDFEKVGIYSDNSDSISIILETPHINTDNEMSAILQFLTIDLNTNSQLITASIIIDGVSITLGTMQTSSRDKITFNIGKEGKIFGIRLTGSISTNLIEIFSIKPDFYGPK